MKQRFEGGKTIFFSVLYIIYVFEMLVDGCDVPSLATAQGGGIKQGNLQLLGQQWGGPADGRGVTVPGCCSVSSVCARRCCIFWSIFWSVSRAAAGSEAVSSGSAV